MPTDEDKIPLTREGLEELKEEYQELTDKKRPAAVKRMANARDIGDMGEDNEYSQAKQELAFIEGRISELGEVINRAVVSKPKANVGRVSLGSKVTVKIGKKKQIFHLVGEWEADPLTQKISDKSPLGQSLLDKTVGDKIEVEAPAGKLVYTIVKIN